MNKKRGFTLIELLAVIVILAIIALIATPIIMNVIENSKKGAAERSAENYLRTIETTIMTEKMESGDFLSDGNYTLTELETKLGTIEVNGTKAEDASIIVRDGQVMDGSTLEINGYVVNIIDGAGKVDDFGIYKTADQIKSQNSTTPTITYNPVTGEKECPQDNINCFGWYVLEDKGDEYAYVSLIMDRNIDEASFINVQEKLNEITKNWTVSTYLPTGQQIANAANDTTWTDSSTSGNISIPAWLRYNLPEGAAYWTSTVYKPFPTEAAYTVSYSGWITLNGFGANLGIRPVILAKKSNLQN